MEYIAIKTNNKGTKQIFRLLNWSIFPRSNRLFVFSFGNNSHWTILTKYFLPIVEIKDYIVLIVGKNIFDQPVKSNMRTHENIQEITTGQGDDCTAICLPEYTYFKKHCKMVQDIFIKRN